MGKNKAKIVDIAVVPCSFTEGGKGTHRIALMSDGRRVMLDCPGYAGSRLLWEMDPKVRVCCLSRITGKDKDGASLGYGDEQLWRKAKPFTPVRVTKRTPDEQQRIYKYGLYSRMEAGVSAALKVHYEGPYGRAKSYIEISYIARRSRDWGVEPCLTYTTYPTGKSPSNPVFRYNVATYLDMVENPNTFRTVPLLPSSRSYKLDTEQLTGNLPRDPRSSRSPYLLPLFKEAGFDHIPSFKGTAILIDPERTAMPERYRTAQVIFNLATFSFDIESINDLPLSRNY